MRRDTVVEEVRELGLLGAPRLVVEAGRVEAVDLREGRERGARLLLLGLRLELQLLEGLLAKINVKPLGLPRTPAGVVTAGRARQDLAKWLLHT